MDAGGSFRRSLRELEEMQIALVVHAVYLCFPLAEMLEHLDGRLRLKRKGVWDHGDVLDMVEVRGSLLLQEETAIYAGS